MNPSRLLAAIPDGLREPLVDAFREICRNFAERRWEPSELNGGKLCEVIYTIIDGTLAGAYASSPSKPTNFLQACRNLEGQPADPNRVGDRSLRILIPRVLVAVYEVRNNRGVGHVGGDVDPNFMDATIVHAMAQWTMAELVRVFHQVSTAEAQVAVDSLVERKLAIVWERDGIKRVLLPKASYRDQTLILLYCEKEWTSVDDLVTWTEYSNASVYKKNLLTPLHKDRLVEFDRKMNRICITTAGVHEVESGILPMA